MNGTGPKGRGPKTGRGLGKCKKVPQEELNQQVGKGMGKRRKSGSGIGGGKRLKYNS